LVERYYKIALLENLDFNKKDAERLWLVREKGMSKIDLLFYSKSAVKHLPLGMGSVNRKTVRYTS
jgi:hypothetical protein